MLRRWCSRSALPLASGSIFFWDSSCASCCELLLRKGEGLLEHEVLGDSFMAAYRSEQIKCNWQLQGPWLRNMSMSPSSLTAVLFVADYPELWLDSSGVRRVLSWMLINTQPLGMWGRKLDCWLAKSKTFPGILGICAVSGLGWKMFKWNPISVLFIQHSSLQCYLLGTINSWSSGWEFTSHVEREWYLQNFRILFIFICQRSNFLSEQFLLHLTSWKLIYNALMDWLSPSVFTLCFQCPLPWYWEAVCVLC